VSELATNACQHAQMPFEVSVDRHGSGLMVEVSDQGPGTVLERDVYPAAECGRGIHIVAALALSWGVRPHLPQGKLVWAQLDC
jgi:anti-sigma regulatory factor (Ser/Thr protein kinase)